MNWELGELGEFIKIVFKISKLQNSKIVYRSMSKNQTKIYLLLVILLGIFCFQKVQAVTVYNCCGFKNVYYGVLECQIQVGGTCPTKNQACVKFSKAYSQSGSELAPKCTEWAEGENQVMNCLDDLKCVASAFDVTWSGQNNQTFTIGEVATMQTSATVKYKGDNSSVPVSDISVECTNCDSNFTTVGGSQNNISFTVNTAKYFEKTLLKQGEYLLDVKVQGKKVVTAKWDFYLKQFDCSTYKPPCSENYNMCFPLEGKCVSRLDASLCNQLTQYPQLCGTQEDGTTPGTKGDVCYWNEQQKQCQTALGAAISKEYAPPPDYYTKGSGILPPCAFDGSCRSVNRLLETVIRFGKNFFAIIGSLAFVFFIYGGITMILSFGNAEKTKKGRDILVAAVIGLIIVFSAYLLIDFVLDAIGVESSFRGIGQ